MSLKEEAAQSLFQDIFLVEKINTMKEGSFLEFGLRTAQNKLIMKFSVRALVYKKAEHNLVLRKRSEN